eukprot:6177471-Pleurochrysis_carterae.AAC.1
MIASKAKSIRQDNSGAQSLARPSVAACARSRVLRQHTESRAHSWICACTCACARSGACASMCAQRRMSAFPSPLTALVGNA